MLPGTLPVPELARRLRRHRRGRDHEAGADVRRRPRRAAAGRPAGRRLYVERASTGRAGRLPVAEVDPDDGAVLLDDHRARPGSASRRRGRATAARTESSGRRAADRELFVVGLGPGPDRWLTPEVAEVLARSTTSSATRPTSTGCRSARGCSGTPRATPSRSTGPGRPSTSRCEGERVAVVSGGDAGVFGMASAVFEAARRPSGTPRSRITVLPGRHRGSGRGGPGRRAAGRRLRRAVAVGPAEAVGGDRAAAARRRGGRPGARDLQPRVAHPDDPGQAGPGGAARGPRSPDTRSSSAATSAGRARSVTVTTLAASRPGHHRHGLPVDHRLVADLARAAAGCGRGVAALSPGLLRQLRSGRSRYAEPARRVSASGSSPDAPVTTKVWLSPASKLTRAVSTRAAGSSRSGNRVRSLTRACAVTVTSGRWADLGRLHVVCLRRREHRQHRVLDEVAEGDRHAVRRAPRPARRRARRACGPRAPVGACRASGAATVSCRSWVARTGEPAPVPRRVTTTDACHASSVSLCSMTRSSRGCTVSRRSAYTRFNANHSGLRIPCPSTAAQRHHRPVVVQLPDHRAGVQREQDCGSARCHRQPLAPGSAAWSSASRRCPSTPAGDPRARAPA